MGSSANCVYTYTTQHQEHHLLDTTGIIFLPKPVVSCQTKSMANAQVCIKYPVGSELLLPPSLAV